MCIRDRYLVYVFYMLSSFLSVTLPVAPIYLTQVGNSKTLVAPEPWRTPQDRNLILPSDQFFYVELKNFVNPFRWSRFWRNVSSNSLFPCGRFLTPQFLTPRKSYSVTPNIVLLIGALSFPFAGYPTSGPSYSMFFVYYTMVMRFILSCVCYIYIIFTVQSLSLIHI